MVNLKAVNVNSKSRLTAEIRETMDLASQFFAVQTSCPFGRLVLDKHK